MEEEAQHGMAPDQRWSIEISKEKMDALAQDPRFHIAVRLARVVNAFRFCHSAVAEFGGVDGSPSNTRQRQQAFFFTCGLLHEAFDVADELGLHLREAQAFREHMVPLLREPRVRRIRKHDLRLLRNKVVFHFDEDVVKTTLPELAQESVEFLDSMGPEKGAIYFPIADVVGMRFILEEQVRRAGSGDGLPPEYDRMKQLIEDVTHFQLRFCDAAEFVIVEILQGFGLEGRPKRPE